MMMTYSQNSNPIIVTSKTNNKFAQRCRRTAPLSDRVRWFKFPRMLSRHTRGRSSALLITIWLLTALFTTAAHADTSPIYTSFLNNKAVGGYDVVSYFQGDMKPVKGKKKFKTRYKGADWYFASKENLDLFTKNPAKYEPQYGGYCSYAVALGDTVKGDPLQYHISDNKLYLNINAKYKQIWLDDKDGYISKADSRWPDVLK